MGNLRWHGTTGLGFESLQTGIVDLHMTQIDGQTYAISSTVGAGG